MNIFDRKTYFYRTKYMLYYKLFCKVYSLKFMKCEEFKNYIFYILKSHGAFITFLLLQKTITVNVIRKV